MRLHLSRAGTVGSRPATFDTMLAKKSNDTCLGMHRIPELDESGSSFKARSGILKRFKISICQC